MSLELLSPNWPSLPPGLRMAASTRAGGVSRAPYQALNLGDHVGDAVEAVAENRRRFVAAGGLPREPAWLRQVHGIAVHRLDATTAAGAVADACWTDAPDQPCAILTADCLPVLFADREGRCVAAAHAGWRGLVAGVLEATVAALPVPPTRLTAWLGPAIGPDAFQIGAEVREAFLAQYPADRVHFRQDGARWRADLFALARARLNRLGITDLHGGGLCTWSDARRFHSYRRDGVCGRMACAIWIQRRV